MALPTERPGPSRAPGRPPDPEREAAILDAALEVLAEVGYDRLTVSAVHRRAHASAKTVYRRWSGKEELMTAALQHAVTRSTPDEVPDTGTLRGDLVATLHRPRTAPTRNLAHGLLAVAATSGELGALALELLRSREARSMKVVLARASERGETGAGLDPMLVADVARGMSLQHLLLTDEPADAEFVETLVDRVLLPVIRADVAPNV